MKDAEGRATRLGELTRAFYERTYDSFSVTRQDPWLGWEELWSYVGSELERRGAASGGACLADIGCGNLRFVRFLRRRTKVPLEVYAFDGCEPLLREGLRALSEERHREITVHEQSCDIVEALDSGRDFMAGVDACDLTVAFGFMHHIPLEKWRERLLRMMADHTAEDGFLAVSFWQFADDAHLLEKARAATVRAQESDVVGALPEGDYLLGWQGDTEAFRFCHHFTEDEIDALSASLVDSAIEVARFSADGKSGMLNRYVVWRHHG